MMKKKMLVVFMAGIAAIAAFAFSSGSAGSVNGKSSAVRRAPINPAFLNWSTNAEYRAQCSRHGYCPSPVAPMKAAAKKKLSGRLGAAQEDVLPARFNLCDSNFVTSVKNQNPYNTCWAHAAMASLESWILKNDGVSLDLSENHLLVNHGFDWGFNYGGNGDMAAAYLLRWSGPLLEAEDPYPNSSSTVSRSPTRHVQRVIKLPPRADSDDNAAIKKALVKFGAVMASYCDLKGYAGYDVSYNSATAAYYCNVDYSPNHAITVVGWDDDYPAANFATTPPGNGAFIIKNSWGTDFGDNGYIYISYYDVTFGMYEDMFLFASSESVVNYGAIYQYDPLGYVISYGYEDDTGWAANIFTAEADCVISAVGFHTVTPNTQYEVYVYSGCNALNPQVGTLCASESGTREYAGYDTLPLSAPVSLTAGQKFSVVVKTVSPDSGYPIALEMAIDDGEGDSYSSAATASAGESFINGDATKYSWEDISTDGVNCCIKAYTQRAGASPLTVPAQSLASAIQGRSYVALVSASGGTPPYSWTVAGSLPPGLSLATNGMLTGTPSSTGSFRFDLTVTDADGTTVTTSGGFFSLTVAEDTALAGDDFAAPVVIYGTNGTYHVDRFDEYTLEDGEPYHTKYPTETGYGWRSQYASAWFKWTAPGDGTVTFRTRSSGGGYVYPTYIAIYTGDSLVSASRQAYSYDYTSTGDYSTSCSLAVSGGTVYRVAAVLGYETSNANLDLTWSGTFANPATQSTEVPVPYSWLEGYYPGVTDFEGRAKSLAANGRNTVEEAYVAGLNPTNSSSVFTASIGVTNDTVYISWSPDLNAGGTPTRDYKIWGAESLTSTWTYPTNALHRFFKVTVGMP